MHEKRDFSLFSQAFGGKKYKKTVQLSDVSDVDDDGISILFFCSVFFLSRSSEMGFCFSLASHLDKHLKCMEFSFKLVLYSFPNIASRYFHYRMLPTHHSPPSCHSHFHPLNAHRTKD